MAKRGEIDVRQTPNGVVIVYQQKLVLFSTIFMLLWVGGWYVGERFAIHAVMNPGGIGLAATSFVGFWLFFWSLAGIAVLFSLLWTVAGSERVKLEGDDFNVCKSIAFVPLWRKRYAVSGMTELRTFAKAETDGDGFTSRINCISFLYQGKMVTFFRGLDPVECQKVCEQLAGSNVWLKSARLKAA